MKEMKSLRCNGCRCRPIDCTYRNKDCNKYSSQKRTVASLNFILCRRKWKILLPQLPLSYPQSDDYEINKTENDATNHIIELCNHISESVFGLLVCITKTTIIFLLLHLIVCVMCRALQCYAASLMCMNSSIYMSILDRPC